ncbi:hypothetical protein CH252_18695 [Rhodococcus sp. 06-1477-1B]|nr:hypothetical protein CH252_18695 [Rhodococcus sp. 06-1477-1B]
MSGMHPITIAATVHSPEASEPVVLDVSVSDSGAVTIDTGGEGYSSLVIDGHATRRIIETWVDVQMRSISSRPGDDEKPPATL